MIDHKYKPHTVSLDSLPEAAAAGAHLAMLSGPSFATMSGSEPNPGTTTGIWSGPVEP